MRASGLLLVVLVGCSSHQVILSEQAPATMSREPPGFESATVIGVVDGDTIDVTITGRSDGPGAGEAGVGTEHTVRLIGIDTPESVQPNTPVECFGRESTSATEALLHGVDVRLVKDVGERDRFGRLLRYVYIGEEMANARLVINGYAYAFTYPPDVRHSQLFLQLQRAARESERGLWSPTTCGGR